MADQGRWFKLWCSALDDPDLANLSIAHFGCWAKLGVYTKLQGTKGTVVFHAPARALCSMFQVASFEEATAIIKTFPHVRIETSESGVTPVTIATVTFENWKRYQGDFSGDRVRRWRAHVTPKRRGDEKRGDEKRRDEKRREAPVVTQALSPNGHGPVFKVPAPVLEALDRCARLGAVPRLRRPDWWQAEVRANTGVDFAAQVYRAEAYLVSHPERHYKRLDSFLHGWLGRADREEEP